MKVAYIVIMYPRVSHTFVQNEVWALRELGVDVSTISIRTSDSGNILSQRDVKDAKNTYNILPLKPSIFFRSHLATFMRHPVEVVATVAQAVRIAPRGLRAKIWAIFYMLEALVVWRECRARGIRHLHAHFANVASDVALLATAFGNRVARDNMPWTWSFTMHGPAEFGEVSRFGLARKTHAANAVVCISDYCRSQLMSLTQPDAWSKMRVVHCGIDLTRFPLRSRPQNRQQSRPQNSPQNNGAIKILCVGRLVPVKAQRLLIDAVATLLADGIAVALTLVGDGPSRADLQRHVVDLGISDSVVFTGSVGQDDIRQIYNDVDIFCLPSFSEGLPVVLMEAMASGLPVITTQIAGIPELVRNGESGLITPPGNLEALTDALRILATDPVLRSTYGAEGRKAVEQNFDVDATAKQLFELFQNT